MTFLFFISSHLEIVSGEKKKTLGLGANSLTPFFINPDIYVYDTSNVKYVFRLKEIVARAVGQNSIIP